MKAGLIINYDRDEFKAGESKYGKEYQIEINKKKLNDQYYMQIVLKAMDALKKKTTKHRKENTIVFQPRKEKILVERHINTQPAHEPYNKWLVAVIKKNEREREQLTNIAKMLKIN